MIQRLGESDREREKKKWIEKDIGSEREIHRLIDR